MNAIVVKADPTELRARRERALSSVRALLTFLWVVIMRLPGPAPAEPAPLDWTDRSGQRRSTPDDGTGTGWVDFDGDGEAGELARDLDRDGIAEQVLVDRDGDGRHETAYLDVDGDGGFDLQLVDADADGRAEETYREGEPGFDL